MLEAFYQDPLHYVGLLFTLIATFGALYFGAGFFGGLPHLFTISAHDGHQSHHRFRITWGAMIMAASFITWELVRIIATWFGAAPANTGAFLTWLGALAVFLIVSGIVVLLINTITKSGGH